MQGKQEENKNGRRTDAMVGGQMQYRLHAVKLCVLLCAASWASISKQEFRVYKLQYE